jgi:hypothetical protein
MARAKAAAKEGMMAAKEKAMEAAMAIDTAAANHGLGSPTGGLGSGLKQAQHREEGKSLLFDSIDLNSTMGRALVRRPLPGAHVESLLAAGADPNVKFGHYEDTPLMIACRFDQVSLALETCTACANQIMRPRLV